MDLVRVRMNCESQGGGFTMDPMRVFINCEL